MPWNVKEFECEFGLSDTAYNQDHQGITLAYAMNVTERECMLCEYSLSPIVSISNSEEPRGTRAYREIKRASGKRVPIIPYNALRDELFVIPGAAMSPAEVILALKNFIERIESHGMIIGKYKDEFIRERINGTLEVD